MKYFRTNKIASSIFLLSPLRNFATVLSRDGFDCLFVFCISVAVALARWLVLAVCLDLSVLFFCSFLEPEPAVLFELVCAAAGTTSFLKVASLKLGFGASLLLDMCPLVFMTGKRSQATAIDF